MAAAATLHYQARSGAVRSEASRAQILGAVRALLEGGAPLASLTAVEIAAAAGVGRSTFYSHFPDKRAVLSELAEAVIASLSDTFAPLVENPDAGRDEVERSVRDLVEAWLENRVVLSGVIELAEYDTDARAAWRSGLDAAARQSAAMIATRPGFDRGEDALTFARVCVWMIERSCHQALRDGDESVDRLIEALTEAIWRMSVPRPTS